MGLKWDNFTGITSAGECALQVVRFSAFVEIPTLASNFIPLFDFLSPLEILPSAVHKTRAGRRSVERNTERNDERNNERNAERNDERIAFR